MIFNHVTVYCCFSFCIVETTCYVLYGRELWCVRILTSKNGLVNAEGGGTDGNNPDVSGDFVTDWGRGGGDKYACLTSTDTLYTNQSK